jgi:hypothetical protein
MHDVNWRTYFGPSSRMAIEEVRRGWIRTGLDAGGKKMIYYGMMLYSGTRRATGYSFSSVTGNFARGTGRYNSSLKISGKNLVITGFPTLR